ncbi:conserved hypothetical protein [Verticillium alfalfae VaMs.102]|uniref:Uncharacterized protein n=1 Tax=Verticillium alfalfae (strain VaMs.102 / ATCC MYA-4576 / FGSC 10136) TaxID=526221 RepID=C9SXN6_VERA1|nr:conserved hypothetical protein [Verticillium alfalfae VaMs.102]EEY23426.1 conserved hypothetical protein [Verticillium alfalfae VaMs.102]
MTRSLLLSRWKHMVWTSSSLASRQKSMPRERQKALVHWEHEAEAARGASCRSSAAPVWRRRTLPNGRIEEKRSRRREVGGLWSSCWGPRGTMVLFFEAAPSTPLVSLRPISTTAPSSSDTTDRFRKLLWKGKAPGPADPYAQQSESSSSQQPDLEAYEAELAELESQTRDLGSLFPDAASRNTRPSRPFSRLKTSFKPTRAPEVNDVGINGYTPALSVEGLEEVGGYEGWWEREGHWGPESEYTPFAAAERVQDAAVLEVLTRQAVVEALAFRKERDEIRLSADWVGTDRAALDRALALRIKITEDGVVALRGNTNAVVKGLAPTKRQLKLARKEEQAQTAGEAVLAEDATIEAEEVTVLGQHVSPEEARELVATWDAEWKDISLADPLLKFAVRPPLFYPY